MHVDDMPDRYSELPRALPNSKTLSSYVANVLLDFRVTLYRIPAYVLTDNGVQLTSKLFAKLCTMPELKNLKTAA